MSESTTTGGSENYPTGTAQRLIQRLEDAAADTLFCIEADREEAVEIAAQEIAAALAAQPAPVREGEGFTGHAPYTPITVCSGTTAPPAGEDLASLSAAATQGAWRSDRLSPMTYYGDVASEVFAGERSIGSFNGGAEMQPGRGLSREAEGEANAALAAALVNAYRAGKLIPAPTQPAAQGEPAASDGEDLYSKLMALRLQAAEFADEAADNTSGPTSTFEAKERGRASAFAEAAEMVKAISVSATRPSVEQVADVIRCWTLCERSSDGIFDLDAESVEFTAEKILALLAPDRGDEQ